MKHKWQRHSLLLGCLVFLFSIACFAWQWKNEFFPEVEMTPPRYSTVPPLPDSRPVYRFAVHPLHNPQRLFANFQPLVDAINKNATDFSVRLVAGRDYGSFEQKLFAGAFDFALSNPLQTLYSLEHGYEVVAKMGDDAAFHGIIIARRDSGISSPADLRDKDMVFPSPTALAATLMPRLFLYKRGLNLQEARTIYSGSQESAIMNVFLRKAAVAGTWPLPWELFLKERPELANELHILWKTKPLINNGIVAHKRVPAEHKRVLVESLCNLGNTDEGKAALERISLSSFAATDTASYIPVVKHFLDDYMKAFPNTNPPLSHEKPIQLYN